MIIKEVEKRLIIIEQPRSTQNPPRRARNAEIRHATGKTKPPRAHVAGKVPKPDSNSATIGTNQALRSYYLAAAIRTLTLRKPSHRYSPAR